MTNKQTEELYLKMSEALNQQSELTMDYAKLVERMNGVVSGLLEINNKHAIVVSELKKTLDLFERRLQRLEYLEEIIDSENRDIN